MPKNALVIDDDEGNRRLIRRWLWAFGYTVFLAETIDGARQAFEAGRYQVAVCDVGLPDGDGLELALQLRKMDPDLHFVIASGEPMNVERAQKAGFAQVLDKPFDIDQLRDALIR